MARGKLDRKALKEDAFQDSMFLLIDWVFKRRVWFITGATLVLAVAAGGFGYYAYRQSMAREQADRFYQAERAAANTRLGNPERHKAAKDGFGKFLRDFPQAKLAPVAWMNLARIAWDEKDAETARKAFQAVLDHSQSSDAQKDLARLGIAKLEESKGNLAASETNYRLLPDHPYEELKAYSLGRIAILRNRPEEARAEFEKAAQGDPGTALAQWAREYLDYYR